MSYYSILTVWFLVTYLISSIPFGFCLAVWIKKINPLKHGSCNIGATNIYRLCGIKLAITTFVLDGLKGFVPVLAAKILYGTPAAIVVAGAAILGHSFSIYLKFKGGKSVATGFFVSLIIFPKVALLTLLVFIAIFCTSHIISLSSIIAVATMPFFTVLLKQSIVEMIFAVLLAIFIIYRHKANLLRLVKGQEPKINFHKTNRV